MKFSSSVIRAVMQAQFQELCRAGGAQAATPEGHYAFRAEDVAEMQFNKNSIGKGVWFVLKDGRVFDVRGKVEAAQPRAPEEESGDAPLSDLDAIDSLPLYLVPLGSATLRAARLVKNQRLETMLELHRDKISGSLQIEPADVAEAFPKHAADHVVIEKLAALPSFDVYSLRSSLRNLRIPVDGGALDISDAMKQRLESHARAFTRPLIRAVYGDADTDLDDSAALTRIFHDTDRARAARRLKLMSRKTGIAPEGLPEFLRAYADVYMSVAYYSHGFDGVAPDIERCAHWLRELRTRRDSAAGTAVHCGRAEEALLFLSRTIRGRLVQLRDAFGAFWQDMNRVTLDRLRQEVEDRGPAAAAMLCGVVVKMRHWSHSFARRDSGGPAMRAQYLVSELEPGLDRLCRFGM